MGPLIRGGEHGRCAFGRSSYSGGGRGGGGTDVAPPSGGAFPGERGLGGALGDLEGPDRGRGAAAARRQKPLPAGAARGLVAGAGGEGARPDPRRSGAPDPGGAGLADHGSLDPPFLQASSD